jgi:hypothetical protein
MSHCEISGYHGGEYEDGSFLTYSTVNNRGSRSTFQRYPDNGCTSEKSAYFLETTRRSIPEI